MVCILTLGLINLVFILLVSNGSDFGTLTGEFGASNIELKWLDKFPSVWLIPDSTGSIWFSSEGIQNHWVIKAPLGRWGWVCLIR